MDIKELNSFKLSDAVKFHDKLNPKLWRGDRLDPAVKKQLLLIAEDFIQELGIDSLDVADITVSGSNAAYTYTPHSDFDLHIIVDMSKLPSSEVYRELFHAKKMLYNDSHDISIHGVPIELYVQDTNEPVVSLGEYSILNDKWIKRPTKRRANLDQNLTREKFDRLKELVLLALETRDIERINKTLKTIRRYRQAGLDKGGEFSPENLAFKAIRKQGGIKKLYDLRDKLHSEMLTIENMYAIPESKKLLDKPTMSVEELAKKHGVSRMDIARQLDKGVKVELEHTSDRKVAREIALDHLAEDPRYYDKLSSVELEEAKSNSITVYHGNQGGIDTDKLYMPMWFSSDYESVLHYTGGDGFVVVAELTPKKTLVIDKKSGIDINTAKENWRKLVAQGYDTVVQDYGDMQDWVVLDPNSIRVVDKISVDEELDESIEQIPNVLYSDSTENFFFDYDFDPKVKQFILSNQFNNPSLSCQTEVKRWAKKLHDAGLSVEIQHGFYLPNHEQDDAEGHTWLAVEGSIFDPTAGQFDDNGEGEYQVHETEDLYETSNQLDEIGFASALDNLSLSNKQVINNSVKDGTIGSRPVFLYNDGPNQIYFMISDGKIDALVYLHDGFLKGMKNFAENKGLVYGLFHYIINLKGKKISLSPADQLTHGGIKWLIKQIQQKEVGFTITDQHGDAIDPTTLFAEWESARTTGIPGPTSITLSESKNCHWHKNNESLLMPMDTFGVTLPAPKTYHGLAVMPSLLEASGYIPNKKEKNASQWKFSKPKINNLMLREAIEDFYKKDKSWFMHRNHGIHQLITKTELRESVQDEVKDFWNQLIRLDGRNKVNLIPGNSVSVMQCWTHLYDYVFEMRGNLTPKEISDVVYDDHGAIDYIKFIDGSRFPDKAFSDRGQGGELDGIITTFFSTKREAEQALTVLNLSVPAGWKLSTANLTLNEASVNLYSDNKPKLIGLSFSELERLSESAGSDYGKFNRTIVENLNLPKNKGIASDTLNLYSVYRKRKINESTDKKLSDTEKKLFSVFNARVKSTVDSVKPGDTVSLLMLSALSIPNDKTFVNLQGFLNPKQIKSITNSNGIDYLHFVDGTKFPETDKNDPMYLAQSWAMTKLFDSYDSASQAYLFYALEGENMSDEIQFNSNVDIKQDISEASGYIPSKKEKNDPRFKTALTVDVKPDSIKKNAKAFNWKTSRAGIPPEANTNGLVESKINEAFNQCYIEAQKLYDLAVEKKLKPQLVQVAGYKGDTDNANDKWKELPPHIWHHYVVIVGDTVLDPTAKQFGDSKPTKYSKEQLDANWAEQYVIKPNTLNQIDEALKPSQYRGIVKDWDKSRYADIFSKYPDRDRNAYRIYLPLPVSKTPTKSSVAPEVEKHLATKGYTIKDYANGMATDGRREMRIGKLLSDTPEVAKKFVNDPARAASRQAQQMVVISRHPYDIAGMSTDRGWNSCMNLKDGAFANYVPIDVKEGTIVAYLINANDRNIENPVARIAIKPFVNTLNPDEVLFGAENRVYGTSSPAFKSAVVKWVNQVNKARGLEGVFIFNRKLYSDSDNKPKIQFKDKQVTAQMKMIMQNPSSIKTIPNPSEALQLAAVNLLSATLGFIENPTEKVQIAAVGKYGPAIRYIDNPSEAVQLAAVENNGHAIEYIENPSEKVQIAAVRQNGYALESIKDPSDEVKIEALKRTGNALQLIDNPTEEMKMIAVSRNGLAINHIQDPSEELQLAAVTNYGPALEYISNPSEEVQLAAIKQNENAIRFIDDPSEEIQLAAISKDPAVIDYIKNPTEKAMQLYRKMRDEIDAQK